MKSPVALAALLAASFVVILGAAAAAAGAIGEAEAASPCNPTLLTPCAGTVLFGTPATPACCAELRAQLGCLCGYARSPNYGSYIRSPNARRLFPDCKLPMPRCA